MSFAPDKSTPTRSGTELRDVEPGTQKRDFPKKGERWAPSAKQFDPAKAKRPAKA